MKRTALLTATLTIALLAAVSLVMAQTPSPSVPNLIDFQGKLTTPAGNPVADGPHSFIFRIFDAPAAGNLLWSEGAVVISTTGGLFTHQLGSSTPLPEALFLDTLPHWLEVEADGAVITPRTQLISNPFSRVANALESRNAILGHVQARTEDLNSGLSTYGCDGLEQVRLWGCSWGEIFLYDSDPTNDVNAVLSAPSAGGYLSLSGGPSFIFLNAGSAGDASALLPTDAVNAGEMLNEPGIAHSFRFGGTTLSSTVAAIESVSIDYPTSGFAVITATGFFYFTPFTTGTSTGARVSINTTRAVIDFDNFAIEHIESTHPSYVGDQGYRSFSLKKVHSVAAGTVKYYVNSDQWAGAAVNTVTINRIHLTAQFFPTNYGTVVSTIAAQPRVGGNVAASTNAAGTDQPSEVQVMTVEDSKARLEAERAKQMAEMEARIKKLEDVSKQQGTVQTVDDNR